MKEVDNNDLLIKSEWIILTREQYMEHNTKLITDWCVHLLFYIHIYTHKADFQPECVYM